jgi:hypothetical protein
VLKQLAGTSGKFFGEKYAPALQQNAAKNGTVFGFFLLFSDR